MTSFHSVAAPTYSVHAPAHLWGKSKTKLRSGPVTKARSSRKARSGVLWTLTTAHHLHFRHRYSHALHYTHSPSLPLPSWTPSHDVDHSLERRWRSFRLPRSDGALQSHRRACTNAKRNKFQHACFVWETSIKPEKKKSAYEGEGGGSKCINQIIPAHWRLSVPRGSSSPICTE